MKKINETSTIGSLIENSVFAQALGGEKMRSVVKHSTIFSFWEEVVGKKFFKFTKPYAIKYSTLYVSAKSPIIAQELTLYQKTLIKKINSYSMPLGVEIKKIVFNYKNFDDMTAKKPFDAQIEDKPVWINDEQLLNVEVDNGSIEEIKKNIEKIRLLNDEQKKTLIKKIIQNQKAKTLQDKK